MLKQVVITVVLKTVRKVKAASKKGRMREGKEDKEKMKEEL